MKKLLLIITLLGFFIPKANYAQNKETDVNIVGHVINKKTKEHIPFVTISIKGTTIGSSTDASGHYFLKHLPSGKHTIVFQEIGYKTVSKEVDLKPEILELNIEMVEDAIMLDETVVTSNRQETKRREAPNLVTVLTPKMFDITSSVNLSQGLNFQPGLRVENNCQSCGFQQVRINGLDGSYSQILIDSKPIFGSLAGVYGLEQIPANMIERVEVVRGGGSAIYGSNAIAGVINIITKEPLYNMFEISNNLTLIDGKTPDNTTAINAAVLTDDHKAGIHVFGSIRERRPYDADDDGYSEIGKLENTSIGFRSFYKTGLNSKLTMEYHHIKEFRRGGDSINYPPHDVNVAEQLDHNIHGGGLNFLIFSKDYKHKLDLYASAQYVGRKSYYGGKDTEAYGRTTGTTAASGAQYSFSMDKLLFMPAELTTGAEYNFEDLDDETLKTKNNLSQTINSGSFYLQNEWKNKTLSFIIGGRLSKHALVDDVIISPRASVRYNPIENITLRGSFSTGYRAPQAFDEDLHVEQNDGKARFITLANGLKPEKSNSFSASIDLMKDFGLVQANLLIEGFYTKLNDNFISEEIETTDKYIKMERRNGTGATVKGFNFESNVYIPKIVQFQIGATLQSSKYKDPYEWGDDDDTPATKNMLRTPNFYGYFTATTSPFKNFDISVTGTYTGKMHVPHKKGYITKEILEKTPEFFDMNLKLSYDIKISSYIIQLNGGMKNIFNQYQSDFDKGKDRDSGYIYGPIYPRCIFFGIKFGIK